MSCSCFLFKDLRVMLLSTNSSVVCYFCLRHEFNHVLQVLALDKRFLDPRRSVNPTQAEKEEGVIPLTDSLPIIPQVSFLIFCHPVQLIPFPFLCMLGGSILTFEKYCFIEMLL